MKQHPLAHGLDETVAEADAGVAEEEDAALDEVPAGVAPDVDVAEELHDAFWETGSATALPATTSASQTSTMAQKSLSSHSSPSSPWTWSTG